MWFWGRWRFPFASGCGIFSAIINLFLLVLYMAMMAVVGVLVIAGGLVLAVLLLPLWLILIFL